MTISEFISSRESDWKELEEATKSFKRWDRSSDPEKIARFASLYRSVSGDLMLADTYQLPQETVRYLNSLVSKAHRCLYDKRRTEEGRRIWETLFYDVPRWIVGDPSFWVALALFWVPFWVCEYKSRVDEDFASEVVGAPTLVSVESMYSGDFDATPLMRLPMVSWYMCHNGSIGLQCFCWGCLGCLPGLFVLLQNSISLGCVFGYMTGSSVNPETTARFVEFTTAHGPFELTAVVLSAAAGLRIGFGAIRTRGYSRIDSMRRAAIQAAPATFAAFILFCAAGTVEALVSPMNFEAASDMGIDPLQIKRGVQIFSTTLLVLYFGGLGGVGCVKRFFSQR